MNGTSTKSVDSEAIAVLLGAIAAKMGRAADLQRCPGGWSIAFVGSPPNSELVGRTQYAAILRATRFYLRSGCYSGGRAEEQVRRTARDIAAGKLLPLRMLGGRRKKKAKKKRKPCPTCGKLR